MPTTIYDYAIIGAGAAGLHLIHAMLDEPSFANKQILVIEKELKEVDDKTWSFWEKGKGYWDEIILHSWDKGQFYGGGKKIDLYLAPYYYKTMRSIDFYRFGKDRIAVASNVHWQRGEVLSVRKEGHIHVKTAETTYQAMQVFDSRIDAAFFKEKDKYTSVIQHFKGWIIETKEPIFDPTSFVMMDYRIKWKANTAFTYVLPTSPTKAMVEFTLFSTELLQESDYDYCLEKYVREILQIKEYTIVYEEFDTIPMSAYPFHKASQENILKIGTAGSWVKASSGYAFKNIEKLARRVVDNLKNNRPVDTNLLNKKFRWYDSIYLNVLANENELGETIFTDMYSKNSIQQMFKFLDDETNVLEDIRIMSSFRYAPFLRALWREVWR